MAAHLVGVGQGRRVGVGAGAHGLACALGELGEAERVHLGDDLGAGELGHSYFYEARSFVFNQPSLEKKDSLEVIRTAATATVDIDSIYAALTGEQKQTVVMAATNNAQMAMGNLEFKADYSFWLNREERMHQMEAINKVTLSLSCLIFFFIGAPLGAIIRKGGLGIPVIVSVIVFIV